MRLNYYLIWPEILTKRNSDKRGVIVEIGSYKDGSTIILAKGSEAGKKIKFMQ